MKRSVAWPWLGIWLGCIAATLVLVVLGVVHGWIWHALTTPLTYVMFYAMGRQHQTDALGIRTIEIIADHHKKGDSSG